jgi:CheY-like chemotaxis protein
VARLISENELTSEFIMLMISTNENKGNYMKCVTMGIDNYLVKPFDLSELINIIQNRFPFVETVIDSIDLNKLRSDIKILVVEDNKMNQKVLGEMLKILGYSYDVADNGYSGYMMAKTTKYDIIFMDLIMPEMDGYQSAQKILKLDNKVLIVAFSADNMPESKRKAELSGIKEFISKPVRIEELKKLITKYFNKN